MQIRKKYENIQQTLVELYLKLSFRIQKFFNFLGMASVTRENASIFLKICSAAFRAATHAEVQSAAHTLQHALQHAMT
jgi:hypothetical protein